MSSLARLWSPAPLGRLRTGLLSLCAFTLACATAYGQSYRRTEPGAPAARLAAKDVLAVQQPSDLTRQYTQVGTYRGHAPTEREAVEAGRSACANDGADLLVLYAPPVLEGSIWKIDGVCARTLTR